MVQDTGKTVYTNTFKPVNTPEPVLVEEDSSGIPVAVRSRQRQAIMAIEDRWRIDDEWWRSEQISRLYFSVVLVVSGQKLVIYKDLITGRWYRQSY
jgi:hypothetical protein